MTNHTSKKNQKKEENSELNERNRQIRRVQVRSFLRMKMELQGDTVKSPMYIKRVSMEDKTGFVATIVNWSVSAMSHPGNQKLFAEFYEIVDSGMFLIELLKFQGHKKPLDNILNAVFLSYVFDSVNHPLTPGITPEDFKKLYKNLKIKDIEDLDLAKVKGLMTEYAGPVNMDAVAKSVLSYLASLLAIKYSFDGTGKNNGEGSDTQ